jgi:hypothetical protein
MEKRKISCTVADFFFLARSKSSLSLDRRDEVKRVVGDGKKTGIGSSWMDACRTAAALARGKRECTVLRG